MSGRHAMSLSALAVLALAMSSAKAARIHEPVRHGQQPREAAWRNLPSDIVGDILDHVPLQPLFAWYTGSGSVRLVSFDAEGQQRLAQHNDTFVWYPARLKFLPSGDSMVVAGRSGEIVLWDARSGRRVVVMEHDFAYGMEWVPALEDMQLFPDGHSVVTVGSGADGASVIIWNLTDGSILRRFLIERMEGDKLVLLGGASIALGGWDDGDPVMVWDVSDGTLQHRFEPQHRVLSMASSPCGAKLAMLLSTGAVSVWNASDWQLVQVLQGALSPDYRHLASSLAMSVGGARVATAACDGVSCTCVFYDGLLGAVLNQRREDGDRWKFLHLAFLAVGDLLVLGVGPRDFVLDGSFGAQLLELAPAPARMVRDLNLKHADVAISPCGRLVAACTSDFETSEHGRDAWLVVWDAVSGRIVLQDSVLAARSSEPCRIAISPPRSMAELLRE